MTRDRKLTVFCSQYPYIHIARPVKTSFEQSMYLSTVCMSSIFLRLFMSNNGKLADRMGRLLLPCYYIASTLFASTHSKCYFHLVLSQVSVKFPSSS